VTRAPAAPVTVSPSGQIASTQPTYTWTPVDGATAYELDVYSYDSAIFVVSEASLSAATVCSGGTCSYTPSVTLTDIDYKFRVRGENGSTAGDFSVYKVFSVGVAPVAPVTVSPTGQISATQPAYVWNPVSGATYYDLYVYPYTSSSYVIAATSLSAATVCSGGTCSFTPATTLTGIDYKFRMHARNRSSTSAFSPDRFFSVGDVPVAAVISAPSGTISATSPAYVWGAVSGASYYSLFVYPYTSSTSVVTETALSASAVCSGAVCSYTPATGPERRRLQIQGARLEPRQ